MKARRVEQVWGALASHPIENRVKDTFGLVSGKYSLSSCRGELGNPSPGVAGVLLVNCVWLSLNIAIYT